MFSKSLIVVALAAGLAAGAAGCAYMSLQDDREARVAAAPAGPTVGDASPAPAVAETEAVVSAPAPAIPSPALAPTEPAAAPVEPAQAPVAPAAAPVEPALAPIAPTAAAVRPAPRRERRTAPSSASANSAPAPSRSMPASRPQPTSQDEIVAAAPTNPPPAATRPAVQEPPSQAAATVSANVPEPRRPQLEQLVVPSSSVIGLRVETPLSSERARVEDPVVARVTRDVLVDGRVAVAAGTRAIGSVIVVEGGGKMRDRARLGVRFHTLALEDGTELPLNTEAIYRAGESPATESTRKIGGAAIGGAILGAIIGGKKGAIVGSATGAAGGAAVVMAGERNPATFPAGTIVTIRLAAPVQVEVEER